MSRYFDGVDDKAIIAAAIASGTPLSMGCWFNPAVAGDGGIGNLIALCRSSSVVGLYALRIRAEVAGDPLEAAHQADSGESSSSRSGSAVSWDTWQHGLAVFASGSSRLIYLNGIAGTLDTAAVSSTASDRTSVGNMDRGGTPTHWFNGLIAHVAIWAAALNATEAGQLAAGANPGAIRPESLLAYWRLAGTDSPEPDAKGGTALSLTGTTAGGSDPGVWVPWRADSTTVMPAGTY